MTKKYKPTSPGRRNMMGFDFSSLTTDKPEKKLTTRLNRSAGRGFGGRITTRHKGGGHKRKYRLIDFKMHDKLDVLAKVESIEYDPNRTCFIALVVFQDGLKRYIIAPDKLKKGQQIVCSVKAAIKIGNRMHLKSIPVGTQVHNVEMQPMKGGQLARSAGSYATVMAHDAGYSQIKLSSGEVRMVKDICFASIGQLSNTEYNTVVIGKAGRSRWLGKRPTVRGSAMNPVDHPHGGGENRQSIGLRKGPKTPWGKLAYGVKTRNKKKASSKFIIKPRGKKKRK